MDGGDVGVAIDVGESGRFELAKSGCGWSRWRRVGIEGGLVGNFEKSGTDHPETRLSKGGTLNVGMVEVGWIDILTIRDDGYNDATD